MSFIKLSSFEGKNKASVFIVILYHHLVEYVVHKGHPTVVEGCCEHFKYA